MNPAAVGAAALTLGLPAAALLSGADVTAPAAVVVLAVAALGHAYLVLGSSVRSRAVEIAVLAAAATAAIIWLAGPPPFSDDVYRYLVDGSTSATGLNPFAYAPDSPKVPVAVDALPGVPNHPELRTIYPPIAQAVFAVVAGLGGGLLGWRLVTIAAAALGAWLCGRLAPRAGALPMFAAVLTHPLVVVTAAGNGNVDIFGLPLVAGALLLARRSRPAWAAAVFGIAAGVKLFPVVFPASLAGRFGIRRAALGAALCLGVLAAVYAPLAGIGAKSVGSLRTYAATWEYNAVVEPLIVAGVDGLLSAAGVPDDLPDPLSARQSECGPAVYYDGVPSDRRWVTRHRLATRLVQPALMFVLIIVAVECRRRRADVATSLVALVVALVLALPSVHPWYALWLVVPALVARSPVGLVIAGALTLGFWAPAAARATGVWSMPFPVLACEYGMIAAMAAARAQRARRGIV